MSLEKYVDYLVSFLKDYARPFNGYILGVSGGLDSAVVAKIAKKAVGHKLFCLVIDIESDPKDISDARVYLEEEKIPFAFVDLSKTYQELVKTYEAQTKQNLTELSKSNVKVRLRMVTLYALGQSMNKLVLGTDNLSENYTGYFTKWGDGAFDIHTLIHLTKREVKEVARILGVPHHFIIKRPSAGLFKDQDDEKELGVTYEHLDNFLLGQDIPLASKERIAYLHRVSKHKRVPIPQPKPYIRKSDEK